MSSSSRSTTKWYISLVRDIRRVDIGEGVRIASGVGNYISSGPVIMLIIDVDSIDVSESRILSILDKINGDSYSISVTDSSVDTSVGVYDCINIFIAILF